MNPIERIYHRTLPFSWRYGSEYRRTLAFLRESQWWSEADLREYQAAQLRALYEWILEQLKEEIGG